MFDRDLRCHSDIKLKVNPQLTMAFLFGKKKVSFHVEFSKIVIPSHPPFGVLTYHTYPAPFSPSWSILPHSPSILLEFYPLVRWIAGDGFYYSVGLQFTSIVVSFAIQELFHFMSPICQLLVLVSVLPWICSEILFYANKLKLFPTLSSVIFRVSCLMLRSLFCFKNWF